MCSRSYDLRWARAKCRQRRLGERSPELERILDSSQIGLDGQPVVRLRASTRPPLSRSGSEPEVLRQPPNLLIEIATIMARGLAGQPVKCGGERARLAEADVERNRGDGQLTIRQ